MRQFNLTFWRTKDSESEIQKQFHDHFNLLYSIARRLTDSDEDAEDLLQNLALLLHQKQRLFYQAENPKAYMIKSLNNLYINQWRSIKNQPHYRAEELSADKDISSMADSVENQTHVQQMSNRIESALQAIPKDQRTVLVMHDVEGYSLPEIASMLDIPIGTLKSRLHRARNKIREQLGVQPFDVI